MLCKQKTQNAKHMREKIYKLMLYSMQLYLRRDINIKY